MKLHEVAGDVNALGEIMRWAGTVAPAVTHVTGGMTLIEIHNPVNGEAGTIICEMSKDEDLEFFVKMVEKIFNLHPSPYLRFGDKWDSGWIKKDVRLNGNINVARPLAATDAVPKNLLPVAHSRSVKAEP